MPAPPPGAAPAWSAPARESRVGDPRLGESLLARVLPRFLRPRRASVAVPIERRMPRHLGMGLAFGFFGLVAGAGFVSGGGYAEVSARYGTPFDMAARALGFGLDKVTISGLVQLHSSEILKAPASTSATRCPSSAWSTCATACPPCR